MATRGARPEGTPAPSAGASRGAGLGADEWCCGLGGAVTIRDRRGAARPEPCSQLGQRTREGESAITVHCDYREGGRGLAGGPPVVSRASGLAAIVTCAFERLPALPKRGDGVTMRVEIAFDRVVLTCAALVTPPRLDAPPTCVAPPSGPPPAFVSPLLASAALLPALPLPAAGPVAPPASPARPSPAPSSPPLVTSEVAAPSDPRTRARRAHITTGDARAVRTARELTAVLAVLGSTTRRRRSGVLGASPSPLLDALATPLAPSPARQVELRLAG